jgi:predicted RNA-binding Zn-ribbon protein involved in translation (DUF1610 family)
MSGLPKWEPQEYRAAARLYDSLECPLCGYIVARIVRDSSAAEDEHPFHFDECPWRDPNSEERRHGG